MEILLYVSAIIAALSLLLIAIFVILTLKSAKKTMGEVSETLKRVETKISGITEKTESLMTKTNQIAEDAEKKLQSLDTLSKSAENLGSTTSYINKSIQDVSDKVSNPPEKYTKIMEQANLVTETIARMYYTFKREKENQKPRTVQTRKKQLPAPQKRIEFLK
ncbi:DUF948 domain-containing protein [Sporosarcina sp. G11-34]|uniref:DUF948 domain-containing protein n=1 Tax=Sporosarcina sp. G11-34 TaxID=2849605 RepID=UPI0022A9C79B|nr:DUF948 domain-containing protein [Sporosarcina sp. G11-34]MCZ2258292.1 DUF948 domain-containing protein [Sporosarcina sp. G11-34]